MICIILSIFYSHLLMQCFLWSVRTVDCRGEPDRWFPATLGGPGGRNRAWRPSPVLPPSSPVLPLFSLLVSFSNFCCSHLFLFFSFLLTTDAVVCLQFTCSCKTIVTLEAKDKIYVFPIQCSIPLLFPHFIQIKEFALSVVQHFRRTFLTSPSLDFKEQVPSLNLDTLSPH